MPGIDQALELKRPILKLRGPGAEPLDVPLAPMLGMEAFDCELETVSDGFHPERGAGIATLHARRPLPCTRRTISTFSCDIARAVSRLVEHGVFARRSGSEPGGRF